jgi:fumarate hydratase subunit beta
MRITTPLTDDVIKQLKAGMQLEIDGVIYTARDQAHQNLADLIKNNKPLPFDPKGAVIYYVGPTPTLPGKIIGAAGPTSSYRMDPYTPALLQMGVKCLIGKGPRSGGIKASLKQHKGIYCAAIGGAAALLSKKIFKNEIIAFAKLETEAMRRLEVRSFPVIVVNDIYGGDAYQQRDVFPAVNV